MKLRVLIFWAALCIPMLLFYTVHAYWVTNTPMQDDFDGLLQPVTAWVTQPEASLAELWRIVSVQDDERRVIANRLVAISITEWKGYLDLRVMKTVGVFLNLIFLGLLLFFVSERGWSRWTLVPMVLVLFSQANFHALHWAMIPVQQIGVFVWGITALWCLSRGYVTFAVIFGLFSLASDVSGVLVWPAGLVTLGFMRQFKQAVIWAVVLGGAVYGYLHGLEVPSYRPSLADNLRAWPDLIGMLWVFPVLALDVFPEMVVSVRIMGLAVVAVVVWFIFGRLFYKRAQAWVQGEAMEASESWIWGSIAFLAATSVVFTLGRASEGIAVILDSRYRHIYHVLIVFLWLLALLHFRMEKWVKPVAGIVFVWHVWIFYATWGYFDYNRQVHLTDMYAWHHQRCMPSTGIYWRMRQEVDEVLLEASEASIYRPADFPFAALAQAEINGQKVARWVNVSPQGQGLEVEDIPRGNGKDDGTFVVLRSAETNYILPIRQLRTSSWRGFLPGKYYQPIGHSILIQHQMIQPGKYQVLIGQQEKGKWRVFDTQLAYEPTLSVGS